MRLGTNLVFAAIYMDCKEIVIGWQAKFILIHVTY